MPNSQFCTDSSPEEKKKDKEWECIRKRGRKEKKGGRKKNERKERERPAFAETCTMLIPRG